MAQPNYLPYKLSHSVHQGRRRSLTLLLKRSWECRRSEATAGLRGDSGAPGMGSSVIALNGPSRSKCAVNGRNQATQAAAAAAAAGQAAWAGGTD